MTEKRCPKCSETKSLSAFSPDKATKTGVGSYCKECHRQFSHRPPPDPVITGEEWRPVVGWEGWYEVSDIGRCRRVRQGKSTYPGKVIRIHVGPKYPQVALTKDAATRQRAIHILVAEAFLGPRPSGLQVNHKDGDKANASVANLEYVTASDNQRHSYAMGLQVPRTGGQHPMTRLSTGDVAMIKASQRQPSALAKELGISLTHLRRIQTGKSRVSG